MWNELPAHFQKRNKKKAHTKLYTGKSNVKNINHGLWLHIKKYEQEKQNRTFFASITLPKEQKKWETNKKQQQQFYSNRA